MIKEQKELDVRLSIDTGTCYSFDNASCGQRDHKMLHVRPSHQKVLHVSPSQTIRWALVLVGVGWDDTLELLRSRYTALIITTTDDLTYSRRGADALDDWITRIRRLYIQTTKALSQARRYQMISQRE